MKNWITLLILILAQSAAAQDTLKIDERLFLQMVWERSPYIQAKLLNPEWAEQQVRGATSAFQPELQGLYEQKQFNNDLYYSRSNAKLQVQTPWAVKVGGGLVASDGIYLNPEANLPDAGLSYLSLELPLGAGLLTDKMRTELKVARYQLTANRIETGLSVNEQLFEAGKTYWKWYECLYMHNLALEAREVTLRRLEFVKAKQQIGEYAAVDTLEAYINWQYRQAFYQEQYINWQRESRKLASFLGIDKELLMAPVVDPDFHFSPLDSTVWGDWAAAHPMMKLMDSQSGSYESKERLAREYFKPTVNVKFDLQQDVTDPFLTSYNIEQNQYLGLKFELPILLRSERARAKQWALKNQMLEFERENFSVQLNNAISANNAVQSTLDSNQSLWRSTAVNYGILLNAEQQRFFLGESNNFLVNRREIQWLETRKKYIKNYVEYRIRVLEYYYLFALLPNTVGYQF